MSFAQIKAADAKCGNSSGGVFKDRRYLINLSNELRDALAKAFEETCDCCPDCIGCGNAHDIARAALAKLERTE